MIVVVLLQNVALLVALSVVQGLIEARWRGGFFARRLVSGVLFGAVAISGMATPLHLGDGIIFDGRSIVLSIAGLFGGPVTALVAAGMATAFRVYLGGVGMLVGIAAIAQSTAFGVIFHYLRRRDPRVVRPWPLWGFGVLVHAVMLGLFLFLPGDPMQDVLARIALPILVFYPLAVALIGRYLVLQENRYITSLEGAGGSDIAQFVAENTPDSIWLMDMDLVFRYVNPSVEPMFGFTVDEFLGSRLSDHADAEHMDQMSELIERTIRGLPDNPGVRFETELRKKDGATLPVEITARMMLGDGGRPVALYGSTRDITDRRLAELEEREARDSLEMLVDERTAELRALNEELRLTNEELIDASEAKSAFMRAMSHELRTPLNSIIGFSDILAKGLAGPVNEEQRRQAEMINHSGQHLLALINDILDLSRIEADRLQLEYETFDLIDLAEDALASVETEAGSKGVSLRLKAPADVLMIESDRLKINQILLNLLGNAVKFTDTGSITIEIDAPHQGMLAVSVTDTGRGISPDKHERIFEEFAQAGTSDEASQAGSGLGLAIARGLARALGGTVTVESEPGAGSTFTLVVPHEP